jgi:preprotein translocase subunit SecE
VKWWIKTREFLGEVVAELKKTTWPTKKEVYGTTLVVVVMVVICSVYLWGIDLILQKPAEWFYPH